MDLRWLFVATLPNSGSTAFARLLETAPDAISIGPRAEGQWLSPALSAPHLRWDPDAPIDLYEARDLWQAAAVAAAGDRATALVVEKSPPNLCRMRPLLAAFTPAPHRLVRFTRDPVAVCASWARRYPPEVIADVFEPTAGRPIETEAAYFRSLGENCGRRFAMLDDLADMADLTIRYEDLAADPGPLLARLAALEPVLLDVDLDADLEVKHYPRQSFRDFNAEQADGLNAQQVAWVGEGLAPYAASVRAFGYAAS